MRISSPMINQSQRAPQKRGKGGRGGPIYIPHRDLKHSRIIIANDIFKIATFDTMAFEGV